MSDRLFELAVHDWLEDGTDRTPEHAIDGVLLAVKTTPQERDLRIPWRLNRMPTLNRAIGIAAVALVAVVGAGGLIYLTGGNPGGVAAQPTTAPTPTATPSVSAVAPPEPSEVAPGITGWTPFTSPVYGYTLSYPEGWQAGSATRAWRPSDGPGVEATTDMFVRPDNEIGVGVSKGPAGDGAGIVSVDGLTAWAVGYCNDMRLPSCETIADRAEPMCLDAGGDPCRAAILVRSDGKNPKDDGEYAFFGDWQRAAPGSAPDSVIVVGVGRGDAYPGAAQYGGSVQLLKSILSTMGVTPTGGAATDVAPGITGWTTFKSPVYGRGWAYPEGWQASPATRRWQPGDTLSSTESTADVFVSPDNDIGIAVWQVPAGDGADIETIDGLEVWAQTFCTAAGGSNCDSLRTRAESMCLDAGGDTCRAATLVRSEGTNPADDAEFAFFLDWPSVMLDGSPDKVTVVMTGRGDAYPGAARYGGAVQLLKSFLTTMGVTPL